MDCRFKSALSEPLVKVSVPYCTVSAPLTLAVPCARSSSHNPAWISIACPPRA